mgnify:CR=1 FL=1
MIDQMKRLKRHINQFGLVTAALGFAFGHTASEFINTLVSSLAMPIISVAIGIGDWETHVIQIGSLELKWGEMVSNTLRLIIVAVPVVYIMRWLVLEDVE